MHDGAKDFIFGVHAVFGVRLDCLKAEKISTFSNLVLEPPSIKRMKTKKSRLVSSKAKHQASVVKKKQQKPDLKNIPGTEYLSNKQKKHVKVHTKSARIKVSGKRKRKVLKRLKHGKKRETEEREDVDMGDESGKKQRRKSKTKSEGMDVDED